MRAERQSEYRLPGREGDVDRGKGRELAKGDPSSESAKIESGVARSVLIINAGQVHGTGRCLHEGQ